MNSETILKYLRGRHTPEEKRQIADWLDADPENNGREFEFVRLLFEIVLTAPEASAGRSDAKFVVRRRLRPFVRAVIGTAAALLLAAGVGFAVHNLTYDSLSDRTASVEVPAGQRVRIVLDDGTAVWLNAQTRIEYPVVFDRRVRRVKVSGEAMFDVTHDASRPFVVETYAADIKVLGTRFNVSADRDNNIFNTTLLEGSVMLYNMMNGQKPIVMQPDDAVALINGQFRKTTLIDAEELCCWPQGLLNVRKPFGELITDMKKAFAVNIIVERETMPQIAYISGQIRISDGIDHAMKVLQYASDFTFEHDLVNNTIIIR